NSELRPGADRSRARAELARARTELIAAERLVEESKARLGEWLGRTRNQIEVAPGQLLEKPPPNAGGAADLAQHPLARFQSADVEIAKARRVSAEKAFRPKFEVLSSLYARGTGALIDGTFRGGAHGLAPSTGNWAVGFGAKLPVFDYKSNRVQREIESHREAGEAARLDKVLRGLRARVDEAGAQVEAATRIAEITPVELDAARTLEEQAQARYRAGLGTVVEVADAQRLLRQAETDDVLARLGIWQALFRKAAAEGDMTELVERSSGR
ncbi:MAG: TolC family protein, partial [bacterium]|nr:TolC family protein [bacterium]